MFHKRASIGSLISSSDHSGDQNPTGTTDGPEGSNASTNRSGLMNNYYYYTGDHQYHHHRRRRSDSGYGRPSLILHDGIDHSQPPRYYSRDELRKAANGSLPPPPLPPRPLHRNTATLRTRSDKDMETNDRIVEMLEEKKDDREVSETLQQRRRRTTMVLGLAPNDFQLAARNIITIMGLFGVFIVSPVGHNGLQKSSSSTGLTRLKNWFRHLTLGLAVLYTLRMLATSIGNSVVQRDITYMVEYLAFGLVSASVSVAAWRFIRDQDKIGRLIRELNAYYQPLEAGEIRSLLRNSRIHLLILISWAAISVTNAMLHWKGAWRGVVMGGDGADNKSKSLSTPPPLPVYKSHDRDFMSPEHDHEHGLREYFGEYLFGWTLWETNPTAGLVIVIVDEVVFHWLRTMSTLLKIFYLALCEFLIHKSEHFADLIDTLDTAATAQAASPSLATTWKELHRKSGRRTGEAAKETPVGLATVDGQLRDAMRVERRNSVALLLDAFNHYYDRFMYLVDRLEVIFAPVVLIWYVDLTANTVYSLRRLTRDLAGGHKFLALFNGFELGENVLFLCLMTSCVGRINDFVNAHLRPLQSIFTKICSASLMDRIRTDNREDLENHEHDDGRRRLSTTNTTVAAEHSRGLGIGTFSFGGHRIHSTSSKLDLNNDLNFPLTSSTVSISPRDISSDSGGGGGRRRPSDQFLNVIMFKLSHPPGGLSAGKFFVVRRSSLLVVASIVISLIVFLYQLYPNTHKERFGGMTALSAKVGH